MALILYGAQQLRLGFNDNRSLALIQSVVNARFSTGQGFFLTLAGRSDRGEETSSSHWMHPSIPVVFIYDVLDVTGEYLAPIEVDQDEVAKGLSYLDEPFGWLSGYSTDGPLPPFWPVDRVGEDSEDDQ